MWQKQYGFLRLANFVTGGDCATIQNTAQLAKLAYGSFEVNDPLGWDILDTLKLLACLVEQLGCSINFTGTDLTQGQLSYGAQSLFFLEESCRVKHSDTQTFSNFSNYFKRVLKLQKRSSNNLQNSYQISSQHQVPKTWVKQHQKHQKPQKQTKIHLQALPCLVPFGSKLVPTWFL